MGRSIQISAYKERRGFLEGKSFQEKELDMKSVDKALVPEGKGKSAFSMVSVPAHFLQRYEDSYLREQHGNSCGRMKPERGRVCPLFELYTAF